MPKAHRTTGESRSAPRTPNDDFAGHGRVEPLVVTLSELGADDLDRAGGKGANLGELVRAGFRVPNGFVITTTAYDRFVDANGLSSVIEGGLHDGDAGRVRTAFERGSIPKDLAEAIRDAYRRLGTGSVAVRSSATAEDLPGAAFAGQQDTFLNVIGDDALIDAIRRCWASLWTDRAVAYRTRIGVDDATVRLAVVVQTMIEADAAGVLFTANPVSGAPDEVVIDATPGLGEAVVSGLVTPDHLRVRRRRWGWQIVERRVGKREVVIRGRPDGGTTRVDHLGPASPALSDRSVRALAGLGEQIARHFGASQDIEWVLANGHLSIVQARPMTALPEPLGRANPAIRLVAGLMTELFPVRPYPLEATTWAPAVFEFLTRFFGALGVRVRPFEHVFVEDDGVVVKLRATTPVRITPGIVRAPVRLLRLVRRTPATDLQADPLLAEVHSRVTRLKRLDLTDLAWPDLVEALRDTLAIPALVWELRIRHLPGPMVALVRLRLLLILLRRGDRFGALALTGVRTKTLEANEALEALATRVRSVPALAKAFEDHAPAELPALLDRSAAGRAFLEAFHRFLDDYGHRETGGTLQIATPFWVDAPQLVLGLIAGLARSEPRARPARLGWQEAQDEVLTHPLLRFPKLRQAFLGLVREARRFPQLREDTRFYFMLVAPAVRRIVLEMGRRLAEVGVVDEPDDVFLLRRDELERIEQWPPSDGQIRDLRAGVTRRRTRRAELDSIPLVDPRLLRTKEVRGEVLVSGIPGSPGTAEGSVRLVRDTSEFGKLRAGEVLVAPYTNPAWTPLFERAAAVVVDSGSAASHAAIVAREYGIPAVMATVDGTRRLADGQVVRVDGSAGSVVRGRSGEIASEADSIV